MQGPKGNRRRRSSERPNYGGIGAAAVLGVGATVTGNEELQALQRKTQATRTQATQTQATSLFAYDAYNAYECADDASASISAQRTADLPGRWESLLVLKIVGLRERRYRVHPNAYCRKDYIMNVTGIFMHFLYKKFEKYRPIDGCKPDTSESEMRKWVDERISINQPVYRTLADPALFKALTLYPPAKADDVRNLWKKFGIELTPEHMEQWKSEFYLAGYYCMTGDTKDIFLPIQFATAILQICQNHHDSLDNVDISSVMDDQKECFADLARLYLNFYTNKDYQDCDGYGPLAPRGKAALGKRCRIACCHCDSCWDTNQNRRTEILENLNKKGMLKRSTFPDTATLAYCKKEVSQSLSIWLQQCIYSDFLKFRWDAVRGGKTSQGGRYWQFETPQGLISLRGRYWQFETPQSRISLIWETVHDIHPYQKPAKASTASSVTDANDLEEYCLPSEFDVKLPYWFHTMYGMKPPGLPDKDDNVPPEGIEDDLKISREDLLNKLEENRSQDEKDKEATWISYMFPVPLVVDEPIVTTTEAEDFDKTLVPRAPIVTTTEAEDFDKTLVPRAPIVTTTEAEDFETIVPKRKASYQS